MVVLQGCQYAVTGNTCYSFKSMFDGLVMVQVNLPIVYSIHPKSNKFVTSVKIKVLGESKLNDRPGILESNFLLLCLC